MTTNQKYKDIDGGFILDDDNIEISLSGVKMQINTIRKEYPSGKYVELIQNTDYDGIVFVRVREPHAEKSRTTSITLTQIVHLAFSEQE